MDILWYTPGSSISTFSAQRSFCLDLRPFRLLMLTRTWKPTSESWRTGIYADFPGKYAPIFCFQSTKCKNALKVVQLRSCGKKPLKKQKSLSEHLFAFFRGCSHMMMYMHSHRSERILCQILPKTDPTLVKDVGRTCHRKCWHGRCAQLSVISSSPYE